MRITERVSVADCVAEPFELTFRLRAIYVCQPVSGP